eukprot:COSAG04_NODE_23771_length_332_cov_1.111588_1_plen_61_part_01
MLFLTCELSTTCVQVMANAQELTSAASIPTAVQRMWTSALRLRDREFCSILNAAVRAIPTR